MRARAFLPRNWSETARSSMLHAISCAAAAMTTAWSRSASDRSDRIRGAAEAARIRAELALVREELDIIDERWRRAPARRRSHDGPVRRMRILELRARRGWTVEETARRFLVTEMTLPNWIRRLDEGSLVRRLEVVCPALGEVWIAQMLARAGLHIGATTVGRMPGRPEPSEGDECTEVACEAQAGIIAKHPNDVWRADLNTDPTAGGFWVPWSLFGRSSGHWRARCRCR